MIIDKDGEVSEVTEEDFKRAIRNPYAEILNRKGTVLIDTEVVEHFEKLAEKKGVPHGKLISEVLKEYLTQTEAGNNL